jgi:hypothetical protein
MPRPLTASARAALQNQTIAVAYLFEITPDEGAQRINTWSTDLSYDGSLWGAAPNKWRIPSGIPLSKTLVPETFTLEFDGGHENDTGEFIGLLLSRTWHQRPVRFIGLLIDTTDGSVIDPFYEWRGKADKITVQSNQGQEAVISLACESGVFRAQERNLQTVSASDQKRRDGTDTMFRNMTKKQDQQIPFGLSWSKVPGYGRGGSNSGGLGGFDLSQFNLRGF